MQEQDKKEFGVLFAAMLQQFEPNKKHDEKALKLRMSMYFQALSDLTLDEFKQAVIQSMRRHRFQSVPMPAQILEYANKGLEQQAERAWERVLFAIEETAFYGDSVLFDDPRIPPIITSHGGWPVVCGMEDEQLRWMRKDFIKSYSLAIAPNRKSQRLVGYSERHNRKWEGNYTTKRIACPYLNTVPGIENESQQKRIEE